MKILKIFTVVLMLCVILTGCAGYRTIHLRECDPSEADYCVVEPVWWWQ